MTDRGGIAIRQDDPRSPAVAALLAHHLAWDDDTPRENAHALGAEALADPSITFWTAWDGDILAGFVALKEFEPGHGEVKSMRVASAMLGRGVGRMLLDHLLATARARHYARVSLETGTSPRYAPANRLYERAGFVDGPVFGGYPPSPHNRFMTLVLQKELRCPSSS